MSTPLGEKTLAAMPIPLDHLAANLDTGYEGLEGGQSHRAASYLLAPPLERLVQFGGVDAMQPDQPRDDGVAIDDLGGAGEAGYVVFQWPRWRCRALFVEILRRIERLRPRPPPFSA